MAAIIPEGCDAGVLDYADSCSYDPDSFACADVEAVAVHIRTSSRMVAGVLVEPGKDNAGYPYDLYLNEFFTPVMASTI